MNKIGLIIKREYLTRVRKRSFIILTFLGPILFAAIYIIPIMLALNASDENMRIAVVDESHWFEERFSNTKEHTFINLHGQPIDSVKELVKKNVFDMALYVPPTQLNIPSNAVVYSIRQVPMEVETYISTVMQKEIEDQKLMAQGVDPEIVSAVKTDVNLSIMRMDENGNEKETFTEIQFILGMILAMLIYMFIMFFGGQVMQGVSEEKTNRIIEVIISSVKPFPTDDGQNHRRVAGSPHPVCNVDPAYGRPLHRFFDLCRHQPSRNAFFRHRDEPRNLFKRHHEQRKCSEHPSDIQFHRFRNHHREFPDFFHPRLFAVCDPLCRHRLLGRQQH